MTPKTNIRCEVVELFYILCENVLGIGYGYGTYTCNTSKFESCNSLKNKHLLGTISVNVIESSSRLCDAVERNCVNVDKQSG